MIQIANRFLPFSHLPGTKTFLPGTHLSCEVFPTHIRIYNMQNSTPECIQEIPLHGFGPCTQFTVTLNLERGYIEASGFREKSFFRYQIFGTEDHFGIRFVKVPPQTEYRPNTTIYFGSSKKQYMPPHRARLFLGCSKQQHIEHMAERLDPAEFIPFLFFLSQMVPEQIYKPTEQDSLMHQLSISDKQKIVHAMQNLFQAGFSSLLLPQLHDTRYLGFSQPVSSASSPLVMMQELYPMILSIFFQETQNHFELLPKLPSEFHAGRLVDLCTQQARISLEWSKKVIRRLTIEPLIDLDCSFLFTHVHTCRVRSTQVQSTKDLRYENKTPIFLKKGERYLFDNFQK
jgi:hypothetical protein